MIKNFFYKIIKLSDFKMFDSDEYEFIVVGGYNGMSVTKYNKLIPTFKDLDKYIVIVTNKDHVYTNSSTKGYECNIYKASLRNKYDRVKPTTITITGNGIDIKADLNSLKSEIRGATLDSILN
jgi:hypothetical protein